MSIRLTNPKLDEIVQKFANRAAIEINIADKEVVDNTNIVQFGQRNI